MTKKEKEEINELLSHELTSTFVPHFLYGDLYFLIYLPC